MLLTVALLLVTVQGTLVFGFHNPHTVWLTTSADEAGRGPRNHHEPGVATETAGHKCDRMDNATDTGGNHEVEVLSYHFRSDVVFRYATTTLQSTIRNCHDQPKQTNFSVTIHESAFISNFSIEMDGVVYKSTVKERDQADSDFKEAVAAGLGAAQVAVSVREANTYSILVNIEPRREVTFNLTYEELLARKLNVYDHVITLNPGQPVKDMKAEVTIYEAENITTLTVFSSNVVYNNSSGLALTQGSTFVNRTSSRSASVVYKSTGSERGQAEQLHVQYDVDRSVETGSVVLMDGFFVHFFAPKNFPPLPKHVIFALDTSGSMWGRKLQQTQEAMTYILRQLRPQDYFTIITFGTKVEVWSPSPQDFVGLRSVPTTLEVTPRNVEDGIEYVKSLQAAGGTDIITALRKSLQIAAQREYNLVNVTDEKEYNRLLPKPMVVFLTDGVPTDGELIPTLILAKVRAANTQIKASIFTLAFGDGASQSFLRKLALQNLGFSRRIYEAADSSLQLQAFYDEISSPLLSNVTFVYKHHGLTSRSLTCTELHTFFSGGEFVVAGKLEDHSPRDDEGGLSQAMDDADDFLVEISSDTLNSTSLGIFKRKPSFNKIKLVKAKRPMGVLERMWAFISVKQRLDQDSISEEKATDHEEHKAEALKLALKYEFVTPLTSLVVVRTTNQSEVVPVLQLKAPSEEPEEETQTVVSNVPNLMGNNIVPKPLLLFMFGAPPALAEQTMTSSPQDATTSPKLTLSHLVWLPDHLNSDGQLVVKNTSSSQLQSFSIKEKEDLQEDAELSTCLTPKGDSGMCRPVASCVLPAFTKSYDEFLTYFCPIGDVAGVCCSNSTLLLSA